MKPYSAPFNERIRTAVVPPDPGGGRATLPLEVIRLLRTVGERPYDGEGFAPLDVVSGEENRHADRHEEEGAEALVSEEPLQTARDRPVAHHVQDEVRGVLVIRLERLHRLLEALLDLRRDLAPDVLSWTTSPSGIFTRTVARGSTVVPPTSVRSASSHVSPAVRISSATIASMSESEIWILRSASSLKRSNARCSSSFESS